MIWTLLAACIVGFDHDDDGKYWFDDCDDKDSTVLDRVTWYQDHDGDGYGDPTRSLTDCERPLGYVDDNNDCDDDSPDVPSERLLDEDEDGFFSSWCPGGDDCDDLDPWVYPGALEFCSGSREDCNNQDWTSDAELVLWFETINSGKEGESCKVYSNLEGSESPDDCRVRKCPAGRAGLDPVLYSDLCCVCDLGVPFAALTDTAPGVWNVLLPEGPDNFAPNGHLSFCEGEWPLSVNITQSSGNLQTVSLSGADWPDPTRCEAGDTQGLSVLRGSGEQPVVFAQGNGGLNMVVQTLVITSGAECPLNPSACPSEVEGGVGGGMFLRKINSAVIDFSCIRQNASTETFQGSDAGGGITLNNATVTLRYTTLRDNCAPRGGGLYASSSSVFMDTVTIADNTAWCSGGGALLFGSGTAANNELHADSLTLEYNTSDSGVGAGIMLWGNPEAPVMAELEDSKVSHNVGPGVTLVNVVRVNDEPYAVCSSVELDDVEFEGQTGGVDVDTYNQFELKQSEVLGQELETVDEATFSAETCP